MARPTSYQRFALYFAPPKDSALAHFGASWLGWNPEIADEPARLQIKGLPASVEELTAAPRRYGLHGTLKAPFRLAEGVSLSAFGAALGDFAEDAAQFEMPPLELATMGGFVALRPARACSALDDFAAECVRAFEPFRAPLNPAELERRRVAPLSPRQDEYLQRFGYPYVLDEFRFHITLTGRRSEEEARAIIAALREPLSPALSERLHMCELCLFGDPGEGAPFRLLRRFALHG